MTMPTLPAQGSTAWYDWAEAIHDRINQVHRPEDYGSVTGDATAAIQAAINAASSAGGGTVLVSPGTYLVNLQNNTPGVGLKAALVMKTKVTLHLTRGAEIKLANSQTVIGDNTTSIIINQGYQATSNYDSDMHIVGEGVINGNSANNASSGITGGTMFGKSSRCSVQGITVKNCRGTAPGPPGETLAVNFWRCRDYRVHNVTVTSDDGGDTASGVGSNQCINGQFSNCITYGLKYGVGNTHWDSSNVLVVNCHSYLNGGHGFLTEHSEDVTFLNCIAGGKVTDYDMGSSNTSLSPFGSLTTLGNGQNSAGIGAGFALDSGTRITLANCTAAYNGSTVAQNTAGVMVYGSTTLTREIVIDGCRIFGQRRGFMFEFGDGAAACVARMKATRILPNNIIGPNKHVDGTQTDQPWSTSSGAASFSKGQINSFLVTAFAPPAATGVAVANPFPFDVEVLLTGGTVTGVTITPGGPTPSAAYSIGNPTTVFRVPYGGSVSVAYTGTLTWNWFIV